MIDDLVSAFRVEYPAESSQMLQFTVGGILAGIRSACAVKIETPVPAPGALKPRQDQHLPLYRAAGPTAPPLEVTPIWEIVGSAESPGEHRSIEVQQLILPPPPPMSMPLMHASLQFQPLTAEDLNATEP